MPARTKIFAATTVALFAFSGHYAIAQTIKPKILVAGISGNTATVDQILSNPTLTTSPEGYTVSSFTITLIPKGRDLIGPYKTEGARITPRVIDSLNSVAGKPVNIVFEDVKVAKDHQEVNVGTVFMKCKQ